jgi:protein-tyrosine-phosphatase/DNA-binding transcriptional ArsR family regulator
VTAQAHWAHDVRLAERAARHAALGEPARLAVVEALVVSDRSPKELAQSLGLASNLLSHHLDVLEAAGLVQRSASAGDGRRKYVRLRHELVADLGLGVRGPRGDMLFLCTRNSARSQLAAAMWTARTGRRASSAGTDPAPRIHRGAVAAARRIGLALGDATPSALGDIPDAVQVVTVCDRVHEELDADPRWWHWSIPDPVADATAVAFDVVVAELDRRIAAVCTTAPNPDRGGPR